MTKSRILLVLAIFAFFSCRKKDTDVPPDNPGADNLVVTTLADNSTAAFNGQTGELRWYLKDAGVMAVNDRKLYMYVGKKYYLHNVNDTVALYAQPDTMKNLWQLDPATGKAIWSGNPQIRPNFTSVCCTPYEQNKLIGIRNGMALMYLERNDFVEHIYGKAIHAYDIASQKIKWAYPINKTVGVKLINDQILVGSLHTQEYYSLDALSGQSTPTLNASIPLEVDNGYVFTLEGRNKLRATDEKSGRVLWEFFGEDLINFSSYSLVIGKDVVYCGSDKGTYYALNKQTGKKIWQFHTEKTDFISQSQLWGGMVFFGAREGRIYALDAETGQLKWKMWAGDGIWHYPESIAVRNGMLYTRAADKRLIAVDAKTGQIKWDHDFGSSVCCQAEGIRVFDRSQLDF